MAQACTGDLAGDLQQEGRPRPGLPNHQQNEGYPFAVLLPDQGAVQGVVLTDQLRNLDWQARQTKRIERLRPKSRTRPSSSSKPS